ncbi:NAD(P)/FAD-dependent oxidoreductase, partial [Acinetobacter baumannii]|nr:NAD(P)/FAD-dependent oxidoreductase [Acinetobacter baumannii]
MTNSKFLYSAFYSYGSQDIMDFLEEADVPLKIERGNRVFPVSDHSSDVIRGIQSQMKKAGVQIHLHTEVKRLVTREGVLTGVE